MSTPARSWYSFDTQENRYVTDWPNIFLEMVNLSQYYFENKIYNLNFTDY